MAPRLRIVLLGLALGFAAAALPAVAVSARPTQDVGGATTTTAIGSSTVVTSTTTAASNPTLVEEPPQPATRLVTESRKVMAVIGGLVVVALALMLLTYRYIRMTRPARPEDLVPADDHDDVWLPPDGDVPEIPFETLSVPEAPDKLTAAVEAAGTAAEGDAAGGDDDQSGNPADHDTADADWEPQSTGEQEQAVIAAGSTVRPSAAARRRALGLPEGP